MNSFYLPKNRFLVVPVLLLALIFQGCGEKNISSKHQAGIFPLTIMHLNDTHSHLESIPLQLELPVTGSVVEIEAGGIARIVSRVEALRERHENSLFLHAGDMTQGTLYFVRYQGDSDLTFFNRMRPDAMVTGNHEYDNGSDHLAGFISKARFPILAANVRISDTSPLKGLLHSSVIRYFGEERVGIIGIVTHNVPEISSPGNDLTFQDEFSAARSVIDDMERQGIDKIILLTHQGYENDLAMAEKLSGVDIIVGGHSHSLLGDFDRFGLQPEGPYPTIVTNEEGDKVLVVQSWNYGLVLGTLEVLFDDNGRILSHQAHPAILVGHGITDHSEAALQGEALRPVTDFIEQNPLLEPVEENSEALVELAGLEKELRVFKEEIVANATEDLKHVRVPTQTMAHGSMVAPFVCRSMLWKVRQNGTRCDIAIQNGGGIRTDIPKGPISVGDIFTLLPFKNTLVTLELTGQEIKNVLEDAIGSILDRKGSNGAFPYTAGLRYSVDSHDPAGSRVHSLILVGENGATQPLDMAGSYSIVTNSYLARGKNGYQPFENNPTAHDTGFIDSHAFMEYLRRKKTLSPTTPSITYN